jgi:hypothetical protein
VLAALPTPTLAADSPASDREPSRDELLDRLAPQARPQVQQPSQPQQSQSPGPAAQSPVPASPSPSDGPTTRRLRNIVPQEAKVDLTVNFDLDLGPGPAAQPAAAAAPGQRDAGPAAGIPSVPDRGHTDASGRAAYNTALSRRRAESVAGILGSLGVAPDRIETIGMGSDVPADPLNPLAAVNRRVVVVALDH